MTTVYCPQAVVAQSVAALRKDGVHELESVVLWLGKRDQDHITVTEAFRPEQVAASHRFWIPEHAMDALRARLRCDRSMIAAQVHTHPREAFHSAADDRWAIIRHEGALSLVVPDFAIRTSADRFLDTTKVFRHSAANGWIEVDSTEVATCLVIR